MDQRKNSSLNWSKVNPFKNKINEKISIIALDGGQLNDCDEFRSVEFNTAGSYAKRWKNEGNKIQFIKKSREHWSDVTGNEAFSEYYVSQIENALGLKEGTEYINYGVEEYKNNTYINTCECFTAENYGFIPIALLVERFGTDLPSMYKLYKKMNQEYLFGMMLVVDALTLNNDRHLGNLGVIIDNQTLKIIKMAPIFDNNLALCPKLSIRDREPEELRADLLRIKPKIGEDFIKSALLVMDNRHYTALKNLREFKFNRSWQINMNENRLKFLEQLVNSQANKLIIYYENEKQ